MSSTMMPPRESPLPMPMGGQMELSFMFRYKYRRNGWSGSSGYCLAQAQLALRIVGGR